MGPGLGLVPGLLTSEYYGEEAEFLLVIYAVSGKKRDQNVFCNISYKTPAIVTKFGK